MAITEKQEVRDLLNAARATRNYCMLTGRSKDQSDQLIDALQPFDGNPNKLTAVHLSDLRKAMRNVCRGIDDYTLTQILAGEPPVRIGKPVPPPTRPDDESSHASALMGLLANLSFRMRLYWPAIWQRLILPGIAVFLLIAAMHYTQWSFNANLILTRLDRHVEYDFHEEVRDVIVIARAIRRNADNGEAPISGGTPAQKQFNQTMSRMKAFHHEDDSLYRDGTQSVGTFNFSTAAWDHLAAVWRLVWPVEDEKTQPQGKTGKTKEEDTAPNDPVVATDTVGQKPPAELESPDAIASVDDVAEDLGQIEEQATQKIARAETKADAAHQLVVAQPEANKSAADIAEDLEMLASLRVAFGGHDGFEESVRLIAKRTDRNEAGRVGDHVAARIQLFKIAETLKDRIALANRFFLPMIYGSLGAALFCLVRVLTPALSDLGPGRAFLRVLFGAFAAMTLSMLFIPANVFSINAQSNPTMIFLACFLFGYSFDAVLAALHRLEAFLQGRLKTQEGG